MINVSNITYRVAGRLLFDGASANIPIGHKVGLVGPNGSGKSTLLKLIANEIQPDSGNIEIEGIKSIDNVIGTLCQDAPNGNSTPLEFTLAADLERAKLLDRAEIENDPDTIANIQTRLMDINSHAAPSKAAAILAGLGFDEADQSRPLTNFSGGWRMRVGIAALLFSEPEILLLDEPTNHLDLEASIWLEGHLRVYRKTLIIVSHDRGLLTRAVTGILHLDGYRLHYYRGSYANFEKLRNEKFSAAEANMKKQTAQRKRLQAFVDRFRYTASKAKQAQSRLKVLERMVVETSVGSKSISSFVFPNPEELSPPLITFSDVSAGYSPDKPILKDLNLRLDAGDRIGFLGQNGNGKSTLAKLLAGEIKATSGQVSYNRKLRVGFFGQHQLDELDPELTAVGHLLQLMPDCTVESLRGRLAAVGLIQDKQIIKVKYLSGGERSRLTIALIASKNPHLLILDEPTNHLDIEAREALASGLNEFGGAVILISHDWELLRSTVDCLWLISNGTMQVFEGDLRDYIQWLKKTRNSHVKLKTGKLQPNKGKITAKISRKGTRQAAADHRKSTADLRKIAVDIEIRLNKLLDDREFLLRKLSDQKTYEVNRIELNKLFSKKGFLDRKILTLEEQWLEVQEKIETE